ncbi:MAG: DUF1857 family protein [Burkholderiaceae bacterium]|nr:DUF1857 family protein [Burkholderiaceae bacterium]
MQFHHLVEINDPLNPLIDTLTRAQVWRGLVLRAEQPGLFMPHLDGCELSERKTDSVTRVLQYGKVNIRDTVVFYPGKRVEYWVPQQPDIAASKLTMSIEEPSEGHLLVRFEYEDSAEEAEVDAFYNEFRQSAYKEADIDTISLIRQLASEGKLD